MQHSAQMERFAKSVKAKSGFVLLFTVSLLISACGGGGGSDDSSNPILNPVALPAARGMEPSIAMADAGFNEAHFAGSGSCSTCHNDEASEEDATLIDEMGRDVSIGKAWQSSVMANSARDPYWHAVVATELALYPSQSETINDTCTRCHAPMANDLARKEGFQLQIFDTGNEADGTLVQGFLSKDSSDSTFNHAMDGVSCSLCHQIADDGILGSFDSMSGGFTVLQSAIKDERPAYGQYADPDVAYMKTQVEFTPTFGPHLSTSESCATCHNLNTNPLDKEGNPVEGIDHFAEQAMYTEWQFSDYANGGELEQQCQSCHMPRLENEIPIATAGSANDRSDFAEHSFLAANTVMQQMMDDYRTQLGIAEDVDFQESIRRNREFLGQAAEVTIATTEIVEDTLVVRVKVENKAGHKLPSGYHSRRAFLHVLVSDSSGSVIYENGRMNADGSVDGITDDINPFTYEPHYDVITDASQVQVYQAITSDAEGELTHSLLAAAGYLKDNRLTPSGFEKDAVPDDIGVKGNAGTDPNFDNGQDIVQYRIAAGGTGAPYSVQVVLMYQPFGYGHLQELFTRSEQIDQVDQFRTIYENTSLRGEILGSDSGIIE